MNETRIKIRPAENKDTESIRELIRYLMEVEEVDDIQGNVETIMRDRISPSFQSEISKTFVAEIDDKVIGVLLVELKHGLTASLAYSVVDKNHQGQGIGGQLVDEAEKYAKSKKIHVLDVLVHKDNRHSKEFHEEKGFELFGYLLRKEI